MVRVIHDDSLGGLSFIANEAGGTWFNDVMGVTSVAKNTQESSGQLDM